MTKLTGSSYAKIALAIGIGVLLVGVAFGGARGCSNARYVSVEGSNMGSASVDAASVKNLSIGWAAGSVQVQVVDDAQAGNEIVFSETSDRGLTKNQQMRWSMSGDTLNIDYGSFFSCMSLAHKSLEVRIPQKYADSFDNIFIDGASGSYRLQDIGCKKLDVQLASGEVTGSNLAAKELTIDVASGRLDLEGSFSERVTTQNASGETRITSSTCPSTLASELASGKVVVTIPENEGFSARIDKASGSFSSAFPTTQQGNSQIYGNGNAQFDVDIASGSFAIERSQ